MEEETTFDEDDVLYMFALEGTPTRALINEYVERWPQYREAIVDLAVDLTIESLTDRDVLALMRRVFG